MSDEREQDSGEEPAPEQPPEREGGLGLTEEFARIESEIESEAGTSGKAEGPEPRSGSARRDESEAADEAPLPEEVDLDGGEADPPESPPEADPPEPEPDPPREPGGEAPDRTDPDTTVARSSAGSARPRSSLDAPAGEHTVVRSGSPTPPGGGAVPIGPGGYGAGPDGEVAGKPRSLWWRFVAGSILIITASATAVALSSLVFLTDVAAQLQPLPDVERIITTIEPGEPQTILIIGSDKRDGTEGDPGRSDTTMLLRVDSDRQVLSLFSLPRDLKVEIPGYGTSKLNEAFTLGGAKKVLKTVKKLTGLEINHVVNVDFQGFADAVDAIECVYVDIDRDYFNDNAGLYAEQQYAEIDVNAGYQRLCGSNALDYVRYRHTDTDIVRNARQQDFLREARRQVKPSEVLPIFGGDTSSKLIDIFTKYTQSDIDKASEVISVLKSFIGVRKAPITEIHFNARLGPSYVTASPEQIKKAVAEFLGEEDSAGPRGGAGANDKRNEETKPEASKPKKEKDPTKKADVIATDATYARFGKTSARRLKFPVYAPTEVAPGSLYDSGSRQYDIRDLDDDKQPAYKMVISLTTPSTLTEYYGVQGTTWSDPPILEDPSETRQIGGRSYDLYYDGDRLRMVAFHDQEGNSYWVSNTLLQTLDEPEMLAIAASMKKYKGS